VDVRRRRDPRGTPRAPLAGGSLERGPDGDGLGVTIFTGGGSKDQQDISAWKCKNGSVPDKDELLHGFAARYTEDIDSDRVPAGDLDEETILYFGADRFDNSGDAQIGFWFLQDEVGCTPNGGGGTGFDGTHTLGDVLILSDFTQGGTQPTISVFTWVGSGGTHGSLNLLAGGSVSEATCGFADDDDFCAIVNPADGVESPWPFLNKRGETDFAHGEFYEGGINLSAPVFGNLADECFASFVVETRSSQSVTATLKDFVAEQFEDCEASITTEPSAASINLGQSITDVATVEGSGAGAPTGTVQFYVCTPTQLTSGVCGPTGGATLGTPVALTPVDDDTSTATSGSYTPSVTGTHCFRATYLPAVDSLYETDTDFAANECFEVIQVASSTVTALRGLPNDTATVTSTGTVAGKVTFTLYEGGTCSGTVLYGPEEVNVVGGTASTSNTTVLVLVSKTVSWKTVFTSSNLGVANSNGACETTQLVINNNG
jgi:hypothetical protein